MTCWRRLRDWYQTGVWRWPHRVLLEELAQADRIDWDRAALDSAAALTPVGQETGKTPTDRGKQGTKRHLVVDAHGIPLAVLVSAANMHDSKIILATVNAIEPIRAKTRGRLLSPTAQAPCPTRSYDYPHLRLALRKRRIILPHRPLWYRAQELPRMLPVGAVGGRTDALLARPLPAPEDPLRAPG